MCGTYLFFCRHGKPRVKLARAEKTGVCTDVALMRRLVFPACDEGWAGDWPLRGPCFTCIAA